jgi:hypothetical protein
MITIKKTIELPDTYDLSRIGDVKEMVFFDIETTGFSGDYAQLYLIGCTWYENDSWQLIQWFADTEASEVELLHAFFAFLQPFRMLVHFNGDGFDIPFLLKRCAHFGLPYGFSALESFDIYKKIKPYRRILGMDSLKQKAIEQFLGVSRKDMYNGGQLIEVYHDYLHEHSQYLYDLLILHNEDDLKGMPEILPILNYPDFFEHTFHFIKEEMLTETDLFGTPHPKLSLTYESDFTSIPVTFNWEKDPVSCCADGRQITFTIELYEGTLKHFYENYKDYYYLIYEDTAIHKSVGEFVEKEARQKATANNCYTKQTGSFLPQFYEALWHPVMRQERKSKIPYTPIDKVTLSDPEYSTAYLNQLLTYLAAK